MSNALMHLDYKYKWIFIYHNNILFSHIFSSFQEYGWRRFPAGYRSPESIGFHLRRLHIPSLHTPPEAVAITSVIKKNKGQFIQFDHLKVGNLRFGRVKEKYFLPLIICMP